MALHRVQQQLEHTTEHTTLSYLRCLIELVTPSTTLTYVAAIAFPNIPCCSTWPLPATVLQTYLVGHHCPTVT